MISDLPPLPETSAQAEILDRDLARALNEGIRHVAGPLLTELVNEATRVYRRCLSEPTPTRIHGVSGFFYRQVLEAADGLAELVEEACSGATVPLQRSALEALLALKYLLADTPEDFEFRAKAFLVMQAQNRLRILKRYDVSVPQGKQVQREVEKFGFAWNWDPGVLERDKKNNEALLALPELADVSQAYEEEMQRWSARKAAAREKGCRPPPRPTRWFALGGGPDSLEQLAAKVGLLPEYEIGYRSMSETAHVEDFGDIVQLSLQDPSYVALQRVRPEDPRELAFRARMVAYYLLEAIHTFISWYRPGELGLAENSSLARWYRRLRPWLKALEDFNPEDPEHAL